MIKKDSKLFFLLALIILLGTSFLMRKYGYSDLGDENEEAGYALMHFGALIISLYLAIGAHKKLFYGYTAVAGSLSVYFMLHFYTEQFTHLNDIHYIDFIYLFPYIVFFILTFIYFRNRLFEFEPYPIHEVLHPLSDSVVKLVYRIYIVIWIGFFGAALLTWNSTYDDQAWFVLKLGSILATIFTLIINMEFRRFTGYMHMRLSFFPIIALVVVSLVARLTSFGDDVEEFIITAIYCWASFALSYAYYRAKFKLDNW